MRPHSSHYSSMMQQSLLTNQMTALSAHQPINIGIAHVVWPQPASKRNRHSHNRWDSQLYWILWLEPLCLFIYLNVTYQPFFVKGTCPTRATSTYRSVGPQRWSMWSVRQWQEGGSHRGRCPWWKPGNRKLKTQTRRKMTQRRKSAASKRWCQTVSDSWSVPVNYSETWRSWWATPRAPRPVWSASVVNWQTEKMKGRRKTPGGAIWASE